MHACCLHVVGRGAQPLVRRTTQALEAQRLKEREDEAAREVAMAAHARQQHDHKAKADDERRRVRVVFVLFALDSDAVSHFGECVWAGLRGAGGRRCAVAGASRGAGGATGVPWVEARYIYFLQCARANSGDRLRESSAWPGRRAWRPARSFPRHRHRHRPRPRLPATTPRKEFRRSLLSGAACASL